MVAAAKKTAGFLGKVGDGIASNAFFKPKFAVIDVLVLVALVWMKVPLI